MKAGQGRVGGLGLRILSVEESYSPPAIDRKIAPPAPPDFGDAVLGRPPQPEPPDTSLPGFHWAGYLIAGAIGAALAILGMILLG